MMKLIFGLFLLSSVAMSARLEDVKILSAMPGQDSLKLKLQMKNGPTDSYFFLDITKDDPESFDKTLHIVKKMMQKDQYRLDLDIQSFSASPSGSYYRSAGVIFYGPAEREPNAVTPPKKKHK